MTNHRFNSLKVGTPVTLAKTLKEYSCGHKTPDGCVYIPAGTTGIVGATKVPAVHSNHNFVCVDFQPTTTLVDCNGKSVTHWATFINQFRVGAFPDDLI